MKKLDRPSAPVQTIGSQKQELKQAICDLANALHQCNEAMGYMSEYDIPITLAEDVQRILEVHERTIKDARDE